MRRQGHFNEHRKALRNWGASSRASLSEAPRRQVVSSGFAQSPAGPLAAFFGSFAVNCKHTRTASALIELFLDVESAHDTFSNNFQVHFAVVDLELHTNYVPGGSETIYDVDQKVGKRTQIIPPLPEDRFLCSFSHIFAGQSVAPLLFHHRLFLFF